MGAGVLDAPALVRLPEVDVESESVIEVRDRRSRELVCLIELTGPANSAGAGPREYLTKRRQILSSPAHLVEIDLLRGGEPLPTAERPPCTCSVMVSRVEDRPLAGFWAIGLRDGLPVIPIPLRPPHADARLDLQALLHWVYDAAGYAHYLYDGVPTPTLSPEEAARARSFLPPTTR